MFGKGEVIGFCMTTLLAAGGQVLAATAANAPLADAAMHGDGDAVRVLLQQQVNVNAAQGDGTTALHWAAYRDDLEMTRLLIGAGADIKAKTRLGDLTPLFMAAKNGNAAMIELLLEARADASSTNANGTTPLMLAAASGDTDALQVLLDHGADVNAKDNTNGQTALMFASAHGRVGAVKLLAENGADLNVVTKVTDIVLREYRSRKKDTRTILKRKPQQSLPVMGGVTALHFAARDGHIDVVRELVAAGADVNRVDAADHMSVTTSAIINGNFDIAMFLVEQEADPNLATKGGLTPLYATIDAQWPERTWYPPPSVTEEKTHYLDLLKALVDSGADLDARLGKSLWFRRFHGDWIKKTGGTAFWRAAKSNDVEAMKLLVASGANPSILTTEGSSPLQAAAGFGLEPQTSNVVPDARLAAVKYLVEEIGADVNSRDKKGFAPLHGAALTENRDVMLYLVAMGADVKARADMIFGGIGETNRDVDGATGDSVADMANGPKPHNLQYPETVAFLESLGSENSDHCRAAQCVVKDFPDDPKAKERKER